MNIFITGGTSGIGWALAKAYLAEGHRVGICGRDLSKLPKDLTTTYPKLSCYQVDVKNLKELEAAVDDFSQGKLDIMFANAGRSVGSKTKMPNFELAREVIDINVNGVLNTFEVALKHMMPAESGHIVVTASVAGLVGLPGAGPYSASKAAVLKLCESFNLDLKKYGINVTAILPGFVDTPLTRKNDHEMPFLMNVDEAARRIKKAVEQKKAIFIFPLPMKLAMYLLDRMPRFLYRRIMSVKKFNYSRE